MAFRRFFAFLIDWFFLFLLILLCGLISPVAFVVAWLIAPILRDCLPGGGLGKRLCGLKVVDQTGSFASLWRRIVRNLPLLFFPIHVIELFAAAVNHGVRLGDLLGGTRVVLRNVPESTAEGEADSASQPQAQAPTGQGLLPRRILAFVIDWVIVYGVGFGIFLYGVFSLDPELLLYPGLEIFQSWTVALGACLLFFLPLLRDCPFKTGSLGKKLCGLAVVDKDGNPVRFWRRLVRSLPLYMGWIELLVLAVNHGVRLGDLLAGTSVVKNKSDVSLHIKEDTQP